MWPRGDLSVETKVLELFTLGYTYGLSKYEIEHAIKPEAVLLHAGERAGGQYAYHFRVMHRFYGILREDVVRYPADWWEAFKERWLLNPKWNSKLDIKIFTKLFGEVKYTEKIFRARAVFPDLAPLEHTHKIYYLHES
jgi:hypothetical protein